MAHIIPKKKKKRLHNLSFNIITSAPNLILFIDLKSILNQNWPHLHCKAKKSVEKNGNGTESETLLVIFCQDTIH